MHNCYDTLRLDQYNTKIFCIIKLIMKQTDVHFIQNKLKGERISSCCPGPGIDVLGGIRPQATVPTKCVRIRIVRRFFDHCTAPNSTTSIDSRSSKHYVLDVTSTRPHARRRKVLHDR